MALIAMGRFYYQAGRMTSKQKLGADMHRPTWSLSRHRSHQRRLPSKPTAVEPTSSHVKNRLLSIPGPSWLWVQRSAEPFAKPFRAYGRAQNRHPYTVQIISSLCIYFLGDLSSQLIQRNSTHSSATESANVTSDSATLDISHSHETSSGEQKEFHYDPERSVRALIIGGVFSLPSYHWFLFLSRNFNVPTTVPYATVISLAIKVSVNQAIFAPLFNTYFFGFQSLLSDLSPSAVRQSSTTASESMEASLQAAWHRIKETVPISWYTSCKFWPLVTAFSFTFIKPQSRSVFAGVVAIAWQSYLGIVNQRAIEKAKSS